MTAVNAHLFYFWGIIKCRLNGNSIRTVYIYRLLNKRKVRIGGIERNKERKKEKKKERKKRKEKRKKEWKKERKKERKKRRDRETERRVLLMVGCLALALAPLLGIGTTYVDMPSATETECETNSLSKQTNLWWFIQNKTGLWLSLCKIHNFPYLLESG